MILWPLELFAQKSAKRITQYALRIYSARDGLPMNGSKKVFQDSKGYLWIGTQEGLIRFDGVHFKRYASPEYPGLKENFIWDIAEDHDGNLWVATNGGGVSRFDGRSFTTFDTTDGLPSNLIVKLLVGKDGTVWIGGEGGLTHFRDGKIERMRFDGGPIKDGKSGRVVGLCEDNEGNLIFSTVEGGIIIQQKNGFKFVDVENGFDSCFKSNSGDLLLGGYGGVIYICRKGQVREFTPSNIPVPAKITGIYDAGEDGLWFGSEGGGIARYLNGEFETLNTKNGLPSGGDYIFSMAVDHEGSFWFASDGGLIQLRDTPFSAFGRLEGLPFEFGSVVSGEKDNAAWVGLRSGGMAGIKNGQVKSPVFNAEFHDKEITSIIPSKNEGLWIGTTNGLYRSKNESLRLITLEDSEWQPQVMALFENAQGTLFAGGNYGSFFIVDGMQKQSKYQLPWRRSGDITSVIETQKGEILIGTHKSGLFRIIDGTVEKITRQHGMLAEGINALYEDGDGVVWIATDGKGLYRYQNGEFASLTSRHGLSFDRLFSVLEDSLGTLWFSGNQGVFKTGKQQIHDLLDGKIDAVSSQAFNHFDGMRETECNGRRQPVAWKAADGRLWFASMAGAIVVDPSDLPKNNKPPPVYIEKIIANEKRELAPPDSVLLLDAPERNLQFQFTALSFAVPERVRFKYKLEGYDHDWIDAGDRRTAFYTNVPKGEYVFRVAACNNDGVWNETGASLRLAVAPFWWETGWAYLAYALLAMLALYAIRQYELKRWHLRSALKMERQQTERLQELDEMKSRFFANISHEFRTPLTLILGPVKQLKQKFREREIREELGGIQRNAGRLLALVNQLLDLSKLESGGMELQLVRGDVVTRIKRLVETYTPLAERKRIAVNFTADSPSVIGYFDRDKLEKIVSNLLSNAFKFTPAGGKISVQLSTRNEQLSIKGNGDSDPRVTDHCLSISVKDSGVGIAPEHIDLIFDRFHQANNGTTRPHEGAGIGLSLVKELVERHHGEIQVASAPGKGSCFRFSIPITQEAYAEDEKARFVANESAAEKAGNGVLESLDAQNSPPGNLGGKLSAKRLSLTPMSPERSQGWVKNGTPQTENFHINENGAMAKNEKPVVLIVDDNDKLLAFLEKCLRENYKILKASDGAAGLKLATKTIPDLVISDVMMPEMDGLTFCQKLKNDDKTCHIPIILLTARASKDNKLEGLECEADDYLVKPFDTPELLARVKNLIAQRRKLRERFSRELNLQPQKIAVSRRDEAFLEKLLGIFETHIDDETFGVGEIAAKIGWSRETAHRKIKALTGMTPKEFLYDFRLRRAEQLLRESDDTVTEIAYQTAFSSPAHLARRFKQKYGLSPLEYRQDKAQRSKGA